MASLLSRVGVNADRELAGDVGAAPVEDDEVLDDSQLFGPVMAWRHTWRPRSSLPFRSSLLPSSAAAALRRSAADEASPSLAVPELAVPGLAEKMSSDRVVSLPVGVLPIVLASGLVLPI